jgi:glutathione S-transferase
MSRVELFSYAACPYAQRTRMVLIEKAIDFELTEIDVYDRPPWFREVSPYGKVPVLRHEGRVVYESAIINQYLDEVYPKPPLVPADPYERAQMRIWMDYCETRFLPAMHRVMSGREQPGRHKENLDKLYEVLHFMEHEGLRRLGDGPFWLRPGPTLADFQFAPFFERFAVYEELAGVQWPKDCTRLSEWFRAMGERKSFRDTRHSLDFHLDQHKKLSALRAAATATASARPA